MADRLQDLQRPSLLHRKSGITGRQQESVDATRCAHQGQPLSAKTPPNTIKQYESGSVSHLALASNAPPNDRQDLPWQPRVLAYEHLRTFIAHITLVLGSYLK
jgi:hypothetical protein